MTTLEKYGVKGDVSVLKPSALGIACKESDVIDIATDLARNRSLTSMDLTNSTVSTEAAKALGTALGKSSIAIIQHICLANCDMHAEAAEVFSTLIGSNDRLQVLELQTNPLRDDGAAHCANLLRLSQTLRTLDLSACKIGPSGARALGTALGDTNKLRSLSLSNNKLRAAGVIALCDGLKRNTSLRTLDLSGNSINSEGGLAIAELLRANDALEHLNLGRNYLSDSVPQIAHAIATRNRKLRLLDISANRVDREVCRALAQVLEGNRVSIACFSIECNAIGDTGLVAIYHAVKGTGIQFLDLSSTGLTHHSGVVVADLIAGCSELNSIQLDGNTIGDAAGVEIAVAFEKSRTLASLNLERSGIGSRTMSALCSAVQTGGVRNLNLSENPDLTQDDVEAVLQALAQQTALEELDLSSLSITETETMLQLFIELFNNNKQLRGVMLEHTHAGAAFPGSVVTRALVNALASAAGAPALADSSTTMVVKGARTGASTTMNTSAISTNAGIAATVNKSKMAPNLQLVKHAETIFKPAWALAVPLDPLPVDPNAPEDGSRPPLVPHPASLHHPLYPGYGNGRFSNATLLQSLSDPVPYNVAISHGPKRPFITSADGASLLLAPPRSALKQSPFSLAALENNPGQLPVTEDQLRRKFSELDVDGNGYLDREEFKALYCSFQHFGLPMSTKESDDLFNRYSGSDRKLQYDEFCILMLKLASR